MLHIPPQTLSASAVTSKIEVFDSLLEGLRKQRDDFAARLADAQNAFEKLDRAVKSLEQARTALSQNTLSIEVESQNQVLNIPQAPTANIASPLTPADVVPHAKEALLESGRPLKRGKLVRLLESKGLVLAGKDKNKNLGTILWRHPRDFVTIEGLGYWVKGIPLAGAYDPEQDDEPLPKTTFVKKRNA